MLRSAFYKALYTIIIFLANLLMANILLPANFGNISLMLVNASIIYLLTGFGTDSIVMHSLTNKKWKISQAVSFTHYAIFIQMGLFLFLEFLHFKTWSSTLLARNGMEFLFSEALYFTGLMLTEKYGTLLYAKHKAFIANQLFVLSASLYLILLILISIRQISSFTLLFNLFCMQSLFQGCFLMIAFYRNQGLQKFRQVRWQQLYVLFKISSVVMITNFIQLLAYRIDFLLLKRLYTEYEIGIYAQVNKFANLMWVMPNIFAFLLLPKFSQMDETRIALVFRYAIISGLGFLFCTIIGTQLFYSFFLNVQYKAGLPSFFLMLPGYLCWSVVIYFGAYFSWRGRFSINLMISSFCFLTVLLFDFLLIPRFSIEGAAIANTIAYSTTLVLCFYIFSKESGIGFSKIIRPQKTDLPILLNLLK